jgi:hypothetical protein
MLKGFENETSQLSDYERSILPAFVKGFSTKMGKDNAIKNKEICAAMKSLGYDVNDARIRKIVNHIRANHLCPVLLASSKGYWVSKDVNEVSDWLESMDGRIMAMTATRNAVLEELKVLKKRGGVQPQGIQTVIPQSVCDCSKPYEYEGLCGDCGKPLKQ